jgi:glycosyltransferase involved in cell wall biosynthesis
MEVRHSVNIFYEEPDPDRWIRFDRYPRRLVRRLVRGPQRPGSIMMIATGLIAGLKKLNVPYRFNDYKYIRKHPQEVACIIGKPHLLEKYRWPNPILFGAGIFSHPVACPDLLQQYPNIKKILVPGPWVREMFTPFYGEDKVIAWPVGIDTDRWMPAEGPKPVDVLVYSKFLWNKEENTKAILAPILEELSRLNLSYLVITYGSYTHQYLKECLDKSKAAIFLCEHESQGMAYQQMLASGVPLLAWDRESYWIDPAFYPHKVVFKSASSVPYWDERCGMKFKDLEEFKDRLPAFIGNVMQGSYAPRQFVLENLTLERSALAYMDILSSVQ